MIDGLDVAHSHYALWFARYDRHAYRGVHLEDITVNADFQPIGTQPKEADFPSPLQPVDDLPPQTIVTSVTRSGNGGWLVRGTAADNGTIVRVVVNEREARASRANFAEWEVELPGTPMTEIRAHAVDAAGNTETHGHVMRMVSGAWNVALAKGEGR
jgi:hypothetical protein